MPYGITQCYLPPGRGDISALTPSQSWYLIKRPRRDARLSWPSWLVTYRDGIPTRRRPPIQVLPGLTCVNFVHATNSANHYATPPTKLCSDARNQKPGLSPDEHTRSSIYIIFPGNNGPFLSACFTLSLDPTPSFSSPTSYQSPRL